MTKHKKKRLLLLVLGILTVAILAAALLAIADGAEKTVRAQGAASVRTAVQRAAVQCYSVEGSYPQTLQHLEDQYGVQINRKLYIVTYDAFASNIMPEIAVLQK
ncbi:MAG: hypothetical protein RSA17_00420 [Ruthenibacterium sp.]